MNIIIRLGVFPLVFCFPYSIHTYIPLYPYLCLVSPGRKFIFRIRYKLTLWGIGFNLTGFFDNCHDVRKLISSLDTFLHPCFSVFFLVSHFLETQYQKLCYSTSFVRISWILDCRWCLCAWRVGRYVSIILVVQEPVNLFCFELDLRKAHFQMTRMEIKAEAQTTKEMNRHRRYTHFQN